MFNERWKNGGNITLGLIIYCKFNFVPTQYEIMYNIKYTLYIYVYIIPGIK